MGVASLTVARVRSTLDRMSKPSRMVFDPIPVPFVADADELAVPPVAESAVDITTPESSRLPLGVEMVEPGVRARATEPTFAPRDPKAPPSGWRGTYNRCGGCGDFLGNATSCAACSPTNASLR